MGDLVEAAVLGHSKQSVHSLPLRLWSRSCSSTVSAWELLRPPLVRHHHGPGAHLQQPGMSLLPVLAVHEEDDPEEQVRDPPEVWQVCRPPDPRAEGQRSCWQAIQGAEHRRQYSTPTPPTTPSPTAAAPPSE